MKRIIASILLVICMATFAQAKIVNTRRETEAIEGVRQLYRLSDSYRNQAGVIIAKIQADIVAHEDKYDPDDVTALKSLVPYVTAIKNDINDFKAQVDTVFSGLND